jgi:signal transduction histidine kinase
VPQEKVYINDPEGAFDILGLMPAERSRVRPRGVSLTGRGSGARLFGYVTVLLAAFTVAMLAGYTPLGHQIDNDVYDWVFRLSAPAPGEFTCALVEIDESSFAEFGGVRALRSILARTLESLAQAPPRVVLVDLTLTDAGDPAEDARLEAAMKRTANLVLASEMTADGSRWQDPLPRFRQWAGAVGHVHAAQDETDGVNRRVPLEKVASRQRRWAMALEAYRLNRGVAQVVESPDDLRVGDVVIPASREQGRAISIVRLPSRRDGSTAVPRVPVSELLSDPAAAGRLRGRVVLIGVTAQSAARDRLMTPYSSERPMPGVEIHANAFETLARGRFLAAARDTDVAAVSVALVVLVGLSFAALSGWKAYSLGAVLVVVATALPFGLFGRGLAFPLVAPAGAAWLSAAGAATFQYFAARRRLRQVEDEKTRYQQAVHFVTHELRTPLTAIQGSSELITRYNLGDEKRKEIAGLIHSESRRLGRMIESFLNMERLTAGQMELKREPVASAELVDTCLARAQAVAERKRIRLVRETVEEAVFTGDRELLEFALYNLITNAVKYSPSGTETTVEGRLRDGRFSLSVRDQGMGMDKKEVRKVFDRFYRTKRAEQSGEKGTGIGLSIVEQIVTQHGGRIEVESTPGKGSCFTLVIPADVPQGMVRG